jgi:chromosome segregation ATPase
LKDEKIEALQEQVMTLKAEKTVLENKLETLTERVEELKKDKETLSKALESSNKALEKEQENILEIKRLMPGAEAEAQKGPHRLTWKERFKGWTN